MFLRPLSVADAPALLAARGDPEVMRYWDWPAQASIGEIERIFENHLPASGDGSLLWFAVALSPNGPAIGECDLSEIDHDHHQAELGFLFARTYWGKGYGHEAAQALVEYAFGPLDLERLWGRFHAGNEASQRLLEKLGFAYERTLRRHVMRDGEWRDCILYGRLRGPLETAPARAFKRSAT